jgi:hypothetical protein
LNKSWFIIAQVIWDESVHSWKKRKPSFRVPLHLHFLVDWTKCNTFYFQIFCFKMKKFAGQRKTLILSNWFSIAQAIYLDKNIIYHCTSNLFKLSIIHYCTNNVFKQNIIYFCINNWFKLSFIHYCTSNLFRQTIIYNCTSNWFKLNIFLLLHK